MYNVEDIKKKNYAVLCYSAEDYWPYSIVSLHDTKEKATKRCNFLNKKNEGGCKYFIGCYTVVTTEELLTNIKYAYMFESEEEE